VRNRAHFESGYVTRTLFEQHVGVGHCLVEFAAPEMDLSAEQPAPRLAGLQFQRAVEMFLCFAELIEAHMGARLDPKDIDVVRLLLDRYGCIAKCGLRVTIVHQHVCAGRQQVRIIRSYQQTRIDVAFDVVCQHQRPGDSHAENQRIDMAGVDSQRVICRLIRLLDPPKCNQHDRARQMGLRLLRSGQIVLNRRRSQAPWTCCMIGAPQFAKANMRK
jgi:hypothetical protein